MYALYTLPIGWYSSIDYFADQVNSLDGYSGWVQRMDTLGH